MRKILLPGLIIMLAIGLVVSCHQTTTQSAVPEKNTVTPPDKKTENTAKEEALEIELGKLWDKAVAQLNAKEYGPALETLYQAEKKAPTNPNIKTSLAYVYTLKGDYDKALEIYNQLLTVLPDNEKPNILAGIADVYTTKGDYDKAMEIYNDLLKVLPNNPNILSCMANVYGKRGDYDNALGIYQQMLKAMPDDNVVFYNIACIYALKGSKEEACEYLHKSVASGYFEWKHMETDTDLDNIRGEDMYKKILASLKIKYPDGTQGGCGGDCNSCPSNQNKAQPKEDHKHMHDGCDQCPDHDKCLKEGKCAGDCDKKIKDGKNKKCDGTCDHKDGKDDPKCSGNCEHNKEKK
jgi:pentatricopeptide repeat protein